mgnify:CR=1 FL=1
MSGSPPIELRVCTGSFASTPTEPPRRATADRFLRVAVPVRQRTSDVRPAWSRGPFCPSDDEARAARDDGLTRRSNPLSGIVHPRLDDPMRRHCSDDRRLIRSTDPETGVASGLPEAAMCVQDIDVQCVLQFTLIHAAGCALHRLTSRVIHRLELSV